MKECLEGAVDDVNAPRTAAISDSEMPAGSRHSESPAMLMLRITSPPISRPSTAVSANCQSRESRIPSHAKAHQNSSALPAA